MLGAIARLLTAIVLGLVVVAAGARALGIDEARALLARFKSR